jgi:APA family basic amino acid/polyamine antiporter
MLGLESATIPADKVRDPARTIPLATMIGTLATAVVCAVACSIVILIVPAERLSASTAPFADAARAFWGERSAALVAIFATISGLGALNGWILLHGEMPYALARAGVFPAAFGRTTRRGTPAFALVVTSSLVTVLVAMNSHRAMVEVFTFMILLATSANLVTYLVCALALLVLMKRGRLASGRRHAALAAAGVLGAGYSLWAIAGAGLEANLWGVLLLAVGLVVRVVAPRSRPSE